MNRNATTQTTINAYNQQIPGVIDSFDEAGRKIVGINQSNIDLNGGDGDMIFPDDPTHPGDAGFAKMAQNFFGGIQVAQNQSLISPPEGTFTPAPHGS